MVAAVVVKDAKKPLTLEITPDNIKNGKPRDPRNCVGGLSCQDRFGEVFEGVEFGSNITKLYFPFVIIRYRTPNAIAKAIPIFDAPKGKWTLPPWEIHPSPPEPCLPIGGQKKGMGEMEQKEKEADRKGQEYFPRATASLPSS